MTHGTEDGLALRLWSSARADRYSSSYSSIGLGVNHADRLLLCDFLDQTWLSDRFTTAIKVRIPYPLGTASSSGANLFAKWVKRLLTFTHESGDTVACSFVLELEWMNAISHLPQTRSVARRKSGSKPRYDPPKRTRNRAAKQEALIQAALGLFATKGYEATTTREIAAAAGCAEGLIHRYFRGKAGLLPALVEHHFSKEIVDLTRELRPAPDLQAEFVQLVLWEVERFWERRDFLKVFIPRAFVDPALAGVLKRAVVSIRARTILERLQRYECCLRLPQQQLEMLAHSVGMLGLVFGFMRPLVLGQDRFEAKQMSTTIAKMLVRSVDLPHPAPVLCPEATNPCR